jgi:phage terminase small subunit
MKGDTTGTPTIPDPEVDSLGPAMLACNAAQRRFAIAAVMYPLAKDWQIAKAAGYSDRSHGGIRVTACRMFQDEKILAAIRECADKEVRSGAMLGIATIKKIVRNDLHRDQFKAAAWLAGLNGFAVAQNINIHQTVKDESGKAIMERIERAAAALGVDAATLLGLQPMKVIEHEKASDDTQP